MRPSLFDRLTRYPVRPWMDPKENRLSSSFGALLEHAPELGRSLASEWIHQPVAGDLTVDIQHWIPSGWIDIDLRFGGSSRPEILIWIEAKYGAGLSGPDQIEKYQQDLLGEPATHRLLLLATPAEFDSKGLDVVRVHEAVVGDGRARLVTWQEIYARTRDWMLTEVEHSRARWLASEFLLFMKEEGLSERPIQPEDVEAFDRIGEAGEALAVVLRLAEQKIAGAWGNRISPKRPEYSADEYFCYDVRKSDRAIKRLWGDTKLQWACESTETVGEDTAFWAGLQSSLDGPLGREANDAWIRRLEGHRFSLYPDRRKRWLGRSKPLSELAGLPSSEAQATALADYVLETFRLATSDDPPA